MEPPKAKAPHHSRAPGWAGVPRQSHNCWPCSGRANLRARFNRKSQQGAPRFQENLITCSLPSFSNKKEQFGAVFDAPGFYWNRSSLQSQHTNRTASSLPVGQNCLKTRQIGMKQSVATFKNRGLRQWKTACDWWTTGTQRSIGMRFVQANAWGKIDQWNFVLRRLGISNECKDVLSI